MRVHTPDPDVTRHAVNGVDLACLAWGDAGPLVVLVHGFPDTARTWDYVGPALASAGFRAVAPYTRGIAPSTLPADGDYASDTLGRDIIGLIDALGEERAHIVGHDFGASAAYSAAGLHPERLHSLTTVAIPHPASIVPTLGKLWGVRHFFTHRLPGAAARFARDDYAQIRVLYERWSPGFAWPDSELEAAKNAYSAPGCCAAALAYYAFVSPRVPDGQRKRIGVRSLVVGGTTDGVATAADFERSRARFTGDLRVEMLPGGHFLHREHPEPFVALLAEFLRG
ncbi:MAG: alpha/beta hydrolase [Alphaproteobacteria bacterium]|nr:alpha/beta hydrolase [Alphaproteobacteria bacterium]